MCHFWTQLEVFRLVVSIWMKDKWRQTNITDLRTQHRAQGHKLKKKKKSWLQIINKFCNKINTKTKELEMERTSNFNDSKITSLLIKLKRSLKLATWVKTKSPCVMSVISTRNKSWNWLVNNLHHHENAALVSGSWSGFKGIIQEEDAIILVLSKIPTC